MSAPGVRFIAECRRCGTLGTWPTWGQAETAAAIHRAATRSIVPGETASVKVFRWMTVAEWTATPAEQRREPDETFAVPHVLMRDDSDGATVLYPVRVDRSAR
jgi:hypothetical protein